MKVQDFKRFKECIKVADDRNPIWWAGYLWLDLTAKQSREVFRILESRDFPATINPRSGRKEIRVPSGIKMYLVD